MSKVVPLKWAQDELLILDQRKLPGKEVWIRARNHETVARAIESLAVRGAPIIGIAAAYGVALAAKNSRATSGSVEAAIARLAETRPTGYNLFSALDRMRNVLANGVEPKLLEREARAIHKEDAAMCEAMALHGVSLMKPGETALTYCNTGALATGGIGTALGVIRMAHKQKILKEVFACETRPVGQGARLTIWECAQEKIPATLICDNMIAALLATGKIQRVFVGADRIAKNGDASNKIGTRGLAVLAHEAGVPFHVVAPSTTFDLSLKSGAEIHIEERDPTEILRGTAGLSKVKGVRVWNPAFDVTPTKYITSFITERGVLSPPFK